MISATIILSIMCICLLVNTIRVERRMTKLFLYKVEDAITFGKLNKTIDIHTEVLKILNDDLGVVSDRLRLLEQTKSFGQKISTAVN